MSAKSKAAELPLGFPPHDAGKAVSLSATDQRALRMLAGFAETALPAMLLLYLAADERGADTLPELKQVIDTLSEVPANLDGHGPEPIHAAVSRLYAMVGALRGRIE